MKIKLSLLVCFLPVVLFAQDVSGPLVTGQSPLELASGVPSLNVVRIDFSESIALATLDATDLNLRAPNGQLISPVTITPVAGSTNQRFDLSFSAQSTRGRYVIQLGPEVEDLAGNLMNQDGDVVNGEHPADQYQGEVTYRPSVLSGSGAPPDLYVENFEAWSPVPSYWSLASGAGGVVAVTNSPASFEGVQHLTLQASPQRLDSHSAALAVDLSAQSAADDLYLEFYARDDNATGGGQFFVELSGDGTNWTTLLSTDLPETYTKYFYDLDAEAAAAGILIDSDVHVRFRLRTINAPNAYVDAVRVVQGDILGPGIVEQAPLIITSNQVSFAEVELLFDEPVDPLSFNDADVQLVAPHGLDVAPLSVAEIPGSTNRRYRVSFAAQSVRGAYRIEVGPNVLDFAGNAMNQNGDAENGDGYIATLVFEAAGWKPPGPTDERYQEGFEAWTPIPDHWRFGSVGTGTVLAVTNGMPFSGAFELQFLPGGAGSEAQEAGFVVNLAPFSAEPDVFLEFYARDNAPGGAGDFVVEISDSGTNWTNLLTLDLAETYTRYLIDLDAMAPGLLDAETHIRFRQQGVQAPAMFVDEVRILTLDLIGPRVLGHAPGTLPALGSTFTNLVLTFNEAVSPATLTEANINLLDPQGFPVTPLTIVPMPGSTNRVVNVSFQEQLLRGSYRFEVGPGVTDLAGNPMNQDADIVNGDGYTASVLYVPEIWTPADPEPVVYLEDFERWTNVPPYWSFYTESAGTISAVSSDAPVSGAMHLLIDPDSTLLRSQIAQVSLDLSSQAGADDVFLAFEARDDNSGGGGQFLVEISGDGSTWFAVLSTDLGEVSQPYLIDLDAESLTAGIALDGDVHIRLRVETTSVPRIFIDDLRIVTGDLFGPFVTDVSPTRLPSTTSSWSRLSVTFNEPIDPVTMTGNEILFVDPQGLLITPSAVLPVPGSSNQVFDVDFALQTTRGVYRLQVGPGVADAAGIAINQDQDALNGEPDDFFAAEISFESEIWTPAAAGTVLYEEGFESWLPIPTHWSFSSVGSGTVGSTANDLPRSGASHLRLQPDNPATASQWAQVVVDLQDVIGSNEVFLDFWARDDNGGASGQFLVELSGEGTNWVELLSTDLARDYTRFLVDLDTVAGAEGIAFDGDVFVRFRVDASTQPTVFLDDLRFVTGDLIGAGVIGQAPLNLASNELPLVQFALEFNELIDAGSFDSSDITFVDPQGRVVPVLGIQPASGPATVFQVSIPAQEVRGVYRIAVGPDVLDLEGNPMNQNGDAQNGDGYQGTLVVESTRWTPPGPAPDIYVETFESWPPSPTHWSFSTKGLGTVLSVATNNPAEGLAHLRFTPPLVSFSDQWARLRVDLQAQAVEQNLFLQFLGRDDTGGSAGQFYVELSGDGSNWVSMLSFDLPEVTTRFLVDLDEVATREGIALDADVYIRFRQQAATLPVIYLDDVRISVGDLLGPEIVAVNPMDLPSGAAPFSAITVLFDEPIDLGSFDETDVALIAPHGFAVSPLTVQVNPGSTNRSFTIGFPAQDVRGAYELSIGPQVLDLVGNPMNQDGDAVNGDGLEQTNLFAPSVWSPAAAGPVLFVEDFESWATAIPSHWSFQYAGQGTVSAVDTEMPFSGVRHLSLSPDSPQLASQWAQVVVDLSAQAGADDVFLEFWARDDNATGGGQFFVEMSDDGVSWQGLLSMDLPEVYTRFLADLDANGIPLDAVTYLRFRMTTTDSPREFIDDLRILTGDLVGPRVLAVEPALRSAGESSFDELRVVFDKPIDPSTFDANDLVLKDPQGAPINPSAVLPVPGQTNRVFALSVPAQTLRGEYQVQVLPSLSDLGGRLLDQNQNGAGGEADDRFETKVIYEAVVWVPPAAGAVLYHENFEDWTDPSQVPDTWSFSAGLEGTLRVETGDAPFEGLRHLVVRPAGTGPGSQWVQFAVDLAPPVNPNNLFLSFIARDDLDTANGEFLVEISGDGTTWQSVLSTDLPEVASAFNLEISLVASQAGVVLDGDVYFRFRLDAVDAPVAFIDEVMILNGDLLGASVVDFEPDDLVPVVLDRITLEFDETVAGVAFDQVALIAPGGVTNFPIARNSSDGRIWTIDFNPLRRVGVYTVIVGPAIFDLAGNPMNQDGDAIQGEILDDRFVTNLVLVGAQTLPYVEDFSSGIPSGIWDTASATGGRIKVIGGELRMDATNGAFALNEAVLHLDLGDASLVTLSFIHRNAGDEMHADGLSVGDRYTDLQRPADLLSVSDDGGASWVVLALLDGAGPIRIDLDAAFASYGLQYNEDIQIKFSQYDDEVWGSDGRGFDNLRVEGFAGVDIQFAGGLPTLRFATVPGNAYRIEWRDDLLLGSWTVLTNLSGDGSLAEVQDPSAAGTRRLYRVTQFTP